MLLAIDKRVFHRSPSRQGALHEAESLAKTAMVCAEAAFREEAYSNLSPIYGNLAAMEYQQVRI